MMINYKKAIFLSKNVTSFPFARLNLPKKSFLFWMVRNVVVIIALLLAIRKVKWRV